MDPSKRKCGRPRKTEDPVTVVKKTVKTGEYIPEIESLQKKGLLDPKLEISQQFSQVPGTESEIKECQDKLNEKIEWVNQSLTLIDDCFSSITENIKVLQKRYQKVLQKEVAQIINKIIEKLGIEEEVS